jgi:hypothetical protein
MPYELRPYSSRSAATLFATANAMVRAGWQARGFSVDVEGWLFRTYTYTITFQRRLPPPRPGAPSIRVVAEDDAMLTFVVALPAKTAQEFDVVSRRVELVIGGVEAEPQVVAADTLEIGPFQGQQDQSVVIRVWNLDDAGNQSESASLFEGVLLDTFAPPAPGQIGIRVIGEQADPPPAVEEPPVVDPVAPADPPAE